MEKKFEVLRKDISYLGIPEQYEQAVELGIFHVKDNMSKFTDEFFNFFEETVERIQQHPTDKDIQNLESASIALLINPKISYYLKINNINEETFVFSLMLLEEWVTKINIKVNPSDLTLYLFAKEMQYIHNLAIMNEGTPVV